MNARKPYIRPMAGWWQRNPFFVEYMVHEGTALFVLAYALELLAGLICLTQGEAAWNSYRAFVASGPMLIINLLIFAAMLYHGYTWFKIMPRTLPPMKIGGQKVAPATITAAGIAAAVGASALVFAVLWFMQRGL
ncbi:fumarate reductase subunit C [Iodobacter sp. LRB]|uniref:fumarate reductase subunit C n=1 Tax=unclassified Iodobacter TaxID=235634 RepID=UPI000C0DAE2C|nr:fumarate reductase subunit C [Iodobacter sp. BJB302]PHV00208.1 fumarate reductase subunit C [Iodobacter sp. BJB302]